MVTLAWFPPLFAVCGSVWLVFLFALGWRVSKDLAQVAKGIDFVRAQELPQILAAAKRLVDGSSTADQADSPGNSSDAHGKRARCLGPFAQGKQHARKRARELYERSVVREGTTLISESLDALPEARLHQVDSAPNTLVQTALFFTIIGLVLTLGLLSNALSPSKGGGTEQVYRTLQGMWLAFIPTAFGLLTALIASSTGAKALQQWDDAVDALDRSLLDDIVRERSQHNESPERAAQMLGVAAKRLSSASTEMDRSFGLLGGTVEQLKTAVSKLDTDSVTARMEHASKGFAVTVKASAELLDSSCSKIAAAADQLAPGVVGLVDGAQRMASVVDGVRESASTMSGQLAGMADALIPVQQAVGGLNEAIASIQHASEGLRQSSDVMNSKIDALSSIVERVQGLNQPVVEGLTAASAKLSGATDGFSQVINDLHSNAGITTATLKENTDTLRGTMTQLDRVTAHWEEYIGGALHEQRRLDDEVVARLASFLQESPPDVQALSAATVRVADSAVQVASLGQRLDAALTAFDARLSDAGARLANQLGGIPEALRPVGEMAASIDLFREVMASAAQSLTRAVHTQERALASPEMTSALQSQMLALNTTLGELQRAIKAMPKAAPIAGANPSLWKRLIGATGLFLCGGAATAVLLAAASYLRILPIGR